MKTSGVYKLVIDDKFYIGSSKDIKRRFSRHINDLRNGKHDNVHLQNAYNKYGSVQPELLFECPVEYLILGEQILLDLFYGKPYCMNENPIAYRPPLLYGNRHHLGYKDSVATRQRKSEAAKNRGPRKCWGWVGRTKKLSIEDRQTISNLYNAGNISQRALAKQYGIDPKTIRNYLKETL